MPPKRKRAYFNQLGDFERGRIIGLEEVGIANRNGKK